MALELKEKSAFEVSAIDFTGKGSTRRDALINLKSNIDASRAELQENLALFDEASALVDAALESEDGSSP